MIAFQIEPASLCLGLLLSGLPLLLWLWPNHRAHHTAQRQLHAQLQASEADRSTLQQAADTASTRHTAELAELRTAAAQRTDELQAQHRQQLEEAAAEHQRQLSAQKDEHAKALADARQEISVVSFPYEETKGDDGWVVDDRSAEVGYQYQMFIRGVPCFEPHRVVVHRVSKKEVNRQKLDELSNRVVNLLEAAASQHPAIQVTKKALGR